MKRSLTTLLFLILGFAAIAQQHPVYEKTAEDVLRWHELYERMRTSEPPTAPVTNVAEFQPSQGVLIAYPTSYSGSGFGIPYTLIAQMSELVPVTIAISSSYQQNQVRNELQQNGVDVSNVNFVVGAVDSYWARDFGPWFIIDGNDQFGVTDFTYNRSSRPNDDNHMSIMAQSLNINHFDFPLIHTGGNYMTDGYGMSASTDLVFEENSDLTEAEIRQLMNDYLGIETYHVTIDPQGDYIAHIDCWGKFLDVDKVLIAQLPQNANRYQEYEEVAAYFANATSSWGNKYQVYRVFEPGSVVSNARTPYTNSLILNDHVFVPVTGTSYDDDAIEVYRAAMPGYTIVPIMERSDRQWKNTDALHCRTHEIADLGMLLIRHYPTLGVQPFDSVFTFRADLTAYSGQDIISDSVLIHYRIVEDGDTTEWQISPMASVGGKTWEGFIAGITDSCEVQYYLSAADLSGRHENHPYIGAPDPHTFIVSTTADNPEDPDDPENPDDTTGIVAFNEAAYVVSPNPAHGTFTVHAPNAKELRVFNTMGQMVLNQKVEGVETVTVNATNWPKGTYIIAIITENSKVVQKKIIIM